MDNTSATPLDQRPLDEAFRIVSRAWISHQGLRRERAEIVDLQASRQQLDRARARARTLLRCAPEG